MKEFIMLIGLPYTGKTTYKEKFYTNDSYFWLSTDEIVKDITDKYNMTYEKNWKKLIDFANSVMAKDLQFAIDQNFNIVWDQTNLTVKTRKQKLAKIPEDYKKIAIVFPTISNEVIEERRMIRKNQIVSNEVIDNMRKIFVMPTVIEGFDCIEVVNG